MDNEETKTDIVDDLVEVAGEPHPSKYLIMSAANEIKRLRNDKKRLIAALRTISEIVSRRYGEDENEDSDRLNAVFTILDDDRLIGDSIIFDPRHQLYRKGMYNKYTVISNRTGMIEPACFVLTPKKDQASYKALEAYANFTDDSLLESNIEEWLDDIPFPKS